MENRGKKAEPKKKGPTIRAVQEKSVPNMAGISDDMKTRYETIPGFSMDDVKIHYNSSKPATVQALTHAQGTNIYMGAGQERRLDRELRYVVQQKQGRIQPTGNVSRMPSDDSALLKREVDLMGQTGREYVRQRRKVLWKSS